MNQNLDDDDGRGGLPSAHMFPRLEACPPSFKLAASVSKTLVPSGPYVRSGNHIHEFLAGSLLFEDLDPDERITALMCQEDEARALSGWETTGAMSLSREKRYFLREGPIPIASAKPDVVYVQEGKRALILNFKSGRLEPEASPKNLQLRVETVCLFSNYPELEEITVGIIQPWVRRRVDLVSYVGSDIALARHQIREIIRAIHSSENTELRLNEYCRFCPALAICPLVFKNITDISRSIPQNALTLPIAIAALSPAAKLEMFRRIKMLEPAFRQIVSILALELEHEPSSIPGLKLKRGDRKRQIADSIIAGQIFSGLYPVSDEELEDTKTMSVTKLQELYAKKSKLAGKEVRREFDRIFDAVLDYTTEKPTLVEE